jgi:ribosome biogenesis GTPase / thiamine phosphate phosphatase
LGLWVAEEVGVASTFADVEEVVATCRFSNCGHSGDVGCAIPVAIADGTLDAARVEAWHSLNEEQAWVERRHDARLQAEEKRKWAALSREGRERSRP